MTDGGGELRLSGMAGPAGAPIARSSLDVLRQLDHLVRRGAATGFASLPTGFQPLDRVLDGGLRPGDLVLVGGVQGVGKTTFTLQMARHLAAGDQAVSAYICYEHEETNLLQRIIGLEAYLARETPRDDVPSLADLRRLFQSNGRDEARSAEVGLDELLGRHRATAAAHERLRAYGERLYLLKGSGAETDVPALRQMIRALRERHGRPVVVFVDYLQKVPVLPAVPTEEERTTRVANELKDLALTEDVPIVAAVAADRAGLQAQRLRMQHLWGSASLSYEPDAVLILNNKYRIVAKKSITFNPHQAQTFKDWIVCTLEKNRSGRDLIDLEFRAHFAHSAFDPAGNVVAETLIEERIDEE